MSRAQSAERAPRTVVIADDLPPSVLAAYLDPYRGDELFVIAPEAHDEWRLDGLNERFLRFDKESNMQWHLKLRGPVDRIVNVRRAGPGVPPPRLSPQEYTHAPGRGF
jgi:hypothetical protein